MLQQINTNSDVESPIMWADFTSLARKPYNVSYKGERWDYEASPDALARFVTCVRLMEEDIKVAYLAASAEARKIIQPTNYNRVGDDVTG